MPNSSSDFFAIIDALSSSGPRAGSTPKFVPEGEPNFDLYDILPQVENSLRLPDGVSLKNYLKTQSGKDLIEQLGEDGLKQLLATPTAKSVLDFAGGIEGLAKKLTGDVKDTLGSLNSDIVATALFGEKGPKILSSLSSDAFDISGILDKGLSYVTKIEDLAGFASDKLQAVVEKGLESLKDIDLSKIADIGDLSSLPGLSVLSDLSGLTVDSVKDLLSSSEGATDLANALAILNSAGSKSPLDLLGSDLGGLTGKTGQLLGGLDPSALSSGSLGDIGSMAGLATGLGSAAGLGGPLDSLVGGAAGQIGGQIGGGKAGESEWPIDDERLKGEGDVMKLVMLMALAMFGMPVGPMMSGMTGGMGGMMSGTSMFGGMGSMGQLAGGTGGLSPTEGGNMLPTNFQQLSGSNIPQALSSPKSVAGLLTALSEDDPDYNKLVTGLFPPLPGGSPIGEWLRQKGAEATLDFVIDGEEPDLSDFTDSKEIQGVVRQTLSPPQ